MKDKVYIRDFLSILYKYKIVMAIIMVISTGFFFELTNYIDKKFKSAFVVNIYSKYFKNPIISEVIPGVYSIQEMKHTIDSMVRETISDDVVDEIGFRFGIYQKEVSEYQMAKQRMYLRDRIHMYSNGGQSYKVSFLYSDPLITYKVSQFLLDKIRSHFINSRIETIEHVKKIMREKLESMSISQKMAGEDISHNALASKNPKILRSELKKINSNISALRKQYNIDHPKIVKLNQRKITIENWLKEYSGQTNSKESTVDPLFMNATNKEITLNISSKFYTKYHDINIALELEKKSLPSYIGILKAPQIPVFPMWPKKRLFASVGLIVGLMICFIYVFIRETMVPSKEDKLEILAKNLKTENFGSFSQIKLSDIEEIINSRQVEAKDLSSSTKKISKISEAMPSISMSIDKNKRVDH